MPDVLRSLCKTSWRLGRRQEAEELLERCLQIARVKLGEEHAATTLRAWSIGRGFVRV